MSKKIERVYTAEPHLITRRRVVGCFVASTFSSFQSSALAQNSYPMKPIKWIVPFANGGSADLIARLMADRMGPALGQAVVIDNRGGNGSVLGTDLGAKATPDGYTWVLSNGAAITTGPLMGQNTSYRAIEDFTHLVLIGSFANALIVRQDHPAKTLQDFLTIARKHPDKISYGSAGLGSAGHLTGELLKQLSKIQMVHIPYKGSGPAFNDLVGGQTDAMFNALISSAPHIRSGRVRALAISGSMRDPEFSNVPTLAETVPGAIGEAWFGLSVPAKTPPQVADRIRTEAMRILATPEMRKKLQELGMQVMNLGPKEFQLFISQEIKKWGPVISQAHIKVDS
jgi:tripartite-type tricarboxylate transporter receptor subunit TctC